jgi:hypothetical protein
MKRVKHAVVRPTNEIERMKIEQDAAKKRAEMLKKMGRPRSEVRVC